MPTRAQWDSMWETLGARTNPRLYSELTARYGEKHRKYHTLQHLDECFDNFAAVRAVATRPAEVELALWFHDAVYDTRRDDNEAKSAAWARACTLAAGLAPEVGERVHALVIATRHNTTPGDTDAQVIVDVDLAILGADAARFDEYERQVRAEYLWVPPFIYRRKRRALLQELRARPALYHTDYFRARHEAQARANLGRSLQQLGG